MAAFHSAWRARPDIVRARSIRPVAPALAGLLLCLAAVASAQRAPLRHGRVVADDGHALTVWSKRPAATAEGCLLLLHGRTWSSLPNFDLHVAGVQASLMDRFVEHGYAVYALDQRGYGTTPRDSSQWLTPERAAADANEVLAWMEHDGRCAAHPALLGYSQGSLTAMLAALAEKPGMSAVILYGFPLDFAHAARNVARAGVLERRRTTIAAAEEDFLTPASTPVGVKEAYGRAAVLADSIRVDWRGESAFARMDPTALRTPVLVINGERDPYATAAHLSGLMSAFTSIDRAWVVLAGADHAAHLERQDAFVNAVVAFLSRDRTSAPRHAGGGRAPPSRPR